MNEFFFGTKISRPLRRLFASRRAMLELSVLLGLCLAVFLSGRCTRFARLADAVRRDTLRLHVQAASNTPEDQLRKLRVRDAVLREAADIFAAVPDKPSALLLAQNALPRLQLAAEQAFWAAGGRASEMGGIAGGGGVDTGVRVYLTGMYFAPTRYESAALPAGQYDALRVELGRHAGRNWFCVLYPALCLPAAEGACYPTGEEQQLVEGGYEVRFAALELWQKLTGWWGDAAEKQAPETVQNAAQNTAQNEESRGPIKEDAAEKSSLTCRPAENAENAAEGGGTSLSYDAGLEKCR